MPQPLQTPLIEIFRQLDGEELVLAQPLGLPQLARLGSNPTQARRHLRPHWQGWLKSADATSLARIAWIANPTSRMLGFDITPPKLLRTDCWQKPLHLKFLVIEWLSVSGTYVAHLPEITLTVLANSAAELQERLLTETIATLRRRDLLSSLQKLHWLQRTSRFSVRTIHPKLKVPTLKDRLRLEHSQLESKKPSILKKVAVNWGNSPTPPVWGIESRVERLAETLAAQPPRSVLLVGPSGVGKTAIARELARRRADFHLAQVPFWATTGSRLVSGMTGFGMWQQRCTELVSEADKSRAILHLGSLVELLEVGRSEHQSQGIGQFLRPSISSGQLLTIAEATPEQMPFLERADAALLEAFERIDISEPTPIECQAIICQAAAALAASSGAVARLSDDGVVAVDLLHRRYAAYSALPGRALRFVDNLLRDAVEADIGPPQVLASFSRETGLPLDLLDPDRVLEIEVLREWFVTRVIGQDEAVGRIVDMLVTVKAQLTRPDRPIASLLFIGPTGVGKTELAKALAEYLFGTRRRLTRFDMSEYAQPGAAARLIGGPGGEGLLTSTVREQPFSVLLFDEFEKADPAVFDLFLQMLGEARLTDKSGRLADFRNCVIIFTSNLGAESYQRGRVGLEASNVVANSAEFFTRAVEEFLRPEMVNRLDQIIPFSALGRSELRQVARRELRAVARRDGLAKLALDAQGEEAFVEKLLDQVGETRYGARPLKRALESKLLVPLAEKLIHPEAQGRLGSVRLGWNDRGPEIDLDLFPQVDLDSLALLVSPLTKISTMRRDGNRLLQGIVGREMRNELVRLERVQSNLRRRQRTGEARPADYWESEAKPAQARAFIAELTAFHAEVVDFEEQLLLQRQDELNTTEKKPTVNDDLRSKVESLAVRWDAFLEQIFLKRIEAADYLTLVLTGSDKSFLLALTHAYTAALKQFGLSYQLAYFLPPGNDRAWPNHPLVKTITSGSSAWADDSLIYFVPGESLQLVLRRQIDHSKAGETMDLRDSVYGTVITCERPAWLWLGEEAGIHARERAKDPDLVRVEVLPTRMNEVLPDPGIIRKDFVQGTPTRIYRTTGIIKGDNLGFLGTHNMPDGMNESLQELLRRLRTRRFREMIQA